jgi:outer membrane protein OmpA-like peptidoglycan-associated protein
MNTFRRSMEDAVKSILHFSLTTPALALCTLAATSACGSSAPTRELVDARRAYNIAEVSPAAKLKPDQLLTARQALNRAEEAHEEEPGSEQEAHFAYLAQRKAEIAVASGEEAAAKQSLNKSDEHYRENLERAAAGNQAQLKSSQQDLQTARAELDKERIARTAAEARVAEAIKSLAQVASVNEEKRGTVITLSGSVLFPSGNDVLSPIARQSLDRVAGVLTDQPPEKPITVEGYTDSRGSDTFNQQLSQRRADAVRGYLVTKGVQSERIQAAGRGEASPIATNDTADGRASNRRVEIVIGNGPGAPPQP